jgi:glycosyltransferase involved in cell wall biosynthesis
MRIAWVTPFNSRSAIARVSAAVTQILSERGHAVTIVRSERDATDRGSTCPTQCAVSCWRELSAHDLDAQSDAIVLNIGDHYDFHAGVLAYIDIVPCLGIFHDFYLYDFFNRWVALEGLGEDVHRREVRLTYGETALAVADRAWRNEAGVNEIADVLPMTEWLARRCGAALAHSRFYIDRLAKSCPGPVSVAPLCFEARQIASRTRDNGAEVVITTIGILNPNKCCDAIIAAIAASPALKERCRYRLVGMISPGEKERLSALCKKVGFSRIDFLGEVDDATLTTELERADILSCLRKPILEGASASAIEGMKSGRPIIVADAGFYSDLPDDLVFKVPNSVEIQPLSEVLERLVSSESLRRETSAKAKEWATKTFSAQAYVTAVESLIAQLIEVKPLLALGGRIGRDLAAIDISEDDPVIGRLAATMQDLFGTTR